MNLTKFLQANNLTKKDWALIQEEFSIEEDITRRQEYMGKEFFVAKMNDKEYVPTVRSTKNGVYPGKSEKDIIYEHNVIDFLNSNNIPAAKPLMTIEEKNYLKINDKLICFYEKIKGLHYNNTDEELKEIVKALGKIHSIGKNFPEKKENRWFFRGNFDLRPFTLKSKEPIIQEAIKKVKDANINWTALDNSLCHGDLHPGNVIFKDGKVVGLFDFETANFDSTVEDFSWVLRTFTSSEGWRESGEFDLTRVEFAKKEYLKYYKTDLSLVPELMLAHYLNYINYKIKRGDDLAETLRQMNWIIKNYC